VRSTRPSPVKASHVYAKVRDAILSGRIEAGTLLRERELAVKFRVSRTPIREALRQLERDGQVQVNPHVGAEVKAVSIQDVFEVLEMRRYLEPNAARIAAKRMTPRCEATLRAIRKTFEEATKRNWTADVSRRYILADERLHSLILDLAGNRRIAQAIKDLRLSIQRYRYLGLSHRFRQNAQEHLAIIAALLESDGTAAEAAMARHLDQFTEDMRQVLLPGAARRPEP
jgi:DNA-binding GntR family transcriptional regulator